MSDIGKLQGNVLSGGDWVYDRIDFEHAGDFDSLPSLVLLF